MLAGRLIGDSQTERWYDSIECFLSEFLEQEPRVAPFHDTSANLWLMNLEERLEHKGSFWAPPKPSICALYKVQLRAICRGRCCLCCPAPVLSVIGIVGC